MEKISKFWPNFTVSAKFHKFQNLRNSFNTLGGPPPPSKFDKTHWYWTSIANFWGGYHLFYVCWPFTDMSGGSVDLILILVCAPKRRHWGFIKWWAEAKATLAFVAETKLLVYNENCCNISGYTPSARAAIIDYCCLAGSSDHSPYVLFCLRS